MPVVTELCYCSMDWLISSCPWWQWTVLLLHTDSLAHPPGDTELCYCSMSSCPWWYRTVLLLHSTAMQNIIVFCLPNFAADAKSHCYKLFQSCLVPEAGPCPGCRDFSWTCGAEIPSSRESWPCSQAFDSHRATSLLLAFPGSWNSKAQSLVSIFAVRLSKRQRNKTGSLTRSPCSVCHAVNMQALLVMHYSPCLVTYLKHACAG